MVEPIFDYQFRMILIGDSTVGKSSLLRFFTRWQISDPTVGVDFYARLIQVRNGTRIKLQLWDTAGQERFRSITKSYYRNSVGAIVAYDITSRESFERIPNWISEAKRLIEPFSPTFLIVACKSDLESQRVVPVEEDSHTPTQWGSTLLKRRQGAGTMWKRRFSKLLRKFTTESSRESTKSMMRGSMGLNKLIPEMETILCCLKALQKNQSAADGHGFIKAVVDSVLVFMFLRLSCILKLLTQFYCT
ncbi:Ras-related protein Rab-39A [Orchesella cincta]|uniref:Ras-related protein Rab-39A n=1 Tax=Orchesella cincta TaxID=48709 RepID=A0A1D2M5X6_ORCCI|nr:Ras-related protein Rab-39A [Orchesella cincta]